MRGALETPRAAAARELDEHFAHDLDAYFATWRSCSTCFTWQASAAFGGQGGQCRACRLARRGLRRLCRERAGA